MREQLQARPSDFKSTMQCIALGRHNQEGMLKVDIMAPATFGKAAWAYLVRDFSLDAEMRKRIQVNFTEPTEQVSLSSSGSGGAAHHCRWETPLPVPILLSIQITIERSQQRQE